MPPLDLYSSFSLIHLNGIAGYHKSESGETGNPPKQLSIINDYNEDSRTVNEFIKFSRVSLEKYPSLIRFAWEREINPEKVITLDIAKGMIAGATVLVIIGYSFPFFNRDIDREIINAVNKPSLEKIYYQNLISGDFLASQFDIPRKIIETVDKVDQFFVPPEL